MVEFPLTIIKIGGQYRRLSQHPFTRSVSTCPRVTLCPSYAPSVPFIQSQSPRFEPKANPSPVPYTLNSPRSAVLHPYFSPHI